MPSLNLSDLIDIGCNLLALVAAGCSMVRSFKLQAVLDGDGPGGHPGHNLEFSLRGPEQSPELPEVST